MPKRLKSGRAGLAEDATPFQPLARPVRADGDEKQRVNLTASAHYLGEAKRLRLNLSEIFDTALRVAVRAQFERELAEYADWHNTHIAEHGVFGAKWRSW
ncbi:MAG: type II toxin-antitoxin system CcdA family antitoxin [Alphaproteobacteria bacterium]|nr:type II toxin-antitoxin system CcdA family antitoxin [Alphaproteobacteria bacterium]